MYGKVGTCIKSGLGEKREREGEIERDQESSQNIVRDKLPVKQAVQLREIYLLTDVNLHTISLTVTR